MSEPNRRTGALALFIATAPLQSAAIVLAACAVAGTLFIALFAEPGLVASQLRNPGAVLQVTGAGLTVIAAFSAAFRIHIRGRTMAWRITPLVIFSAWQILSMIYCLEVPLDKPAEQFLYSHSPDCFLFILAASIPVALILFPLLRLHRAHLGWSASAMTGLAISSAAVLLMQFFHHFEMNLGDWAIHLLAMGIVVGSSAYVGQVLSSR